MLLLIVNYAQPIQKIVLKCQVLQKKINTPTSKKVPANSTQEYFTFIADLYKEFAQISFNLLISIKLFKFSASQTFQFIKYSQIENAMH